MLTYPDIDPVAISLGPLKVRWYGLMYVLGLAVMMAFSLLKGAEILGPKRANLIKQAAYESGMDPVGTARERAPC